MYDDFIRNKLMTAFSYKGYGRIYTNPENIQEVENIIKELNEFEWDYYPGDIVASWEAYPSVVWVGKFELDEDLFKQSCNCLLYTSPSPRDVEESRMPSSA